MAPAAPVVLSALASDKDDVRAITQGGSVSAADLGLSPQVVESLANSLGITTLFSMQAAVVSHLTCVPDRDVVLCAPTGSGKTLAYALPIVSALSSRVVPRLRAVVIVPTRDLAAQVHRVFAALVSTGPGTPGPDLSVAVAVGASSVSREAPAVCAADILIATPGRLVEHTKNTPSFSLQFVSFLIGCCRIRTTGGQMLLCLRVERKSFCLAPQPPRLLGLPQALPPSLFTLSPLVSVRSLHARCAGVRG
jgi:ATP-dependent RNA helicase DDX51/DBP6